MLFIDQLSEICLKEEDEKFIREIIETPVGIVILGSKSWAKAIIVNELLGCTLLPVCLLLNYFSKIVLTKT